MRRRDRDPFGEVGTATRAAIDLVLAQPDAPRHALRVFLVVIRETSSSSRLWDERWRSQIADLAGISDRSCARNLAWLHELGAIEWNPGRRNVPSRVGLPDPVGHLDGALEDPSEPPEWLAEDGPLNDPPAVSAPSGEPQCAKSDDVSAPPDGTHQEKGFREEGGREEGPELQPEGPFESLMVVPGHLGEFEQRFGQFEAIEGPDRAALALASLVGRRCRFTYASKFAAALDTWVADNPRATSVAAADGARIRPQGNCGRPGCRAGNVLDEDGELVGRCPCVGGEAGLSEVTMSARENPDPSDSKAIARRAIGLARQAIPVQIKEQSA